MKARVEQHLATLEAELEDARQRVGAGETVTLDHLDATVQALADDVANLPADTVADVRPRVNAVMAAYEALRQAITDQLNDIQQQLHNQRQRARGLQAYEQWQACTGPRRQTRS